MNKCFLTEPDWFQCCCNCVYLRPVHHHCTTEPKPTKEQMNGRGCQCGVQKGWACTSPEIGRIYDNWPEHSVGCELYTPLYKHSEILPS